MNRGVLDPRAEGDSFSHEVSEEKFGRRVLYLIPTIGGGGAERQITYLCAHLHQLGWECHVALLKGGAYLNALEESSAKVHWLNASSNYDPRLILQARKLINSLRPDVFQTWMPMMDIFGGIASIGTGVPWIISERNMLRGFRTNLKIGVVRAMAARADSIIANSAPGLSDWNAERMARRASKVMIPNSVPVARIREAARGQAAALSDADPRPFVLFAGRLEPQKNIETTFAAMRQAMREDQTFRIVLCGDGSLRGLAKDFQAEPEFSGRVEYQGYTATLWGWMTRAAAFISLSHFEGMPNAAAEAAALHCPLVLSSIESHTAIFESSEVLFVSPDDPSAVASALLHTLSNSADVQQRVEKAFERASSWTPEATAAAHARHYESVLTRHAGHPDGSRGAASGKSGMT